jgi:hypothetical protein
MSKVSKFVKGEFVLVPNRKEALKLRGAQLNVYLAICAHADETGGCFPSLATIAREVEYGPTAVKEALRSLVALELLDITERTRENGSDTTNYYQMILTSSQGGVAVAPGGGSVERPPITKPIKSLANAKDSAPKSKKEKEQKLIGLVNEITGRDFRVLPSVGVKKTLDSFSLEEIAMALSALVQDDWHAPKLKEFSISYFVRSTTIDKFLAIAKQNHGNQPQNDDELRARIEADKAETERQRKERGWE